MIYLLIGQPPGGSSTVHMYTDNTKNDTKKKYIEQHKNQEECGPCPAFAGFTLAFALQLRKKHGKTLVRVTIHKYTIRIQEYDKRKSHINSKLHMNCIPSNNGTHSVTKTFTTLHPTTLTLTPLHHNCRHFISSHVTL